MKRFATATAILCALSAPAFAGGFAAEVVEPVIVAPAEPAPSSSMTIIVPIVALALIALAVTGGDDDDDDDDDDDGEEVTALTR